MTPKNNEARTSCSNNNENVEEAEDVIEQYDYLFGFGSIINTTTHAPWLKTTSTSTSSSSLSSSSSTVLPGAIVTLSKDFGYTRQWNFRSDTGFTALGVTNMNMNGNGNTNEDATTMMTSATTSNNNNTGSDINGVLFRVPQSMIPGFDRREVGYEKVAVPSRYLHFVDAGFRGGGEESVGQNEAEAEDGTKPIHHRFTLAPSDRIWLYVPLPSHRKTADENHPLLQSYVDTVLQGCLAWGGQTMAETFLQTTGGWSPYFLNDTPSSRRPWLYRKDYATIDTLLQTYTSKTHFGDRKHPEEFASAFHRRMKGTWSLPRRNKNFTGREMELQELRGRFHQDSSSSSSSQTVVRVQVAGMGGVGKTQLVTEYCYRYFPSEYGLVVWLNAESAEALVADYRQLLMDLAQEDASEVVTLVAAESLGNQHHHHHHNKYTYSSPNQHHDSPPTAPSHRTPSTDNVGSISDNSRGGIRSSSNKSNTATQETDEIVREVKTRLFRSQVPWLLVFDNLEDRSLLDAFVPRGAGTRYVSSRH
jgi:GTPase SAR1 family protein